MSTDIDVQELARALALIMDPDALWTVEDCANYLRKAPRYFREQIASVPGFPKPVRMALPDARQSQPMWYRRDIIAWMKAQQQGKKPQGGRPRKAVSA